MKDFIFPSLALVAITTVSFLIFFIILNNRRPKSLLPPGNTGFPVIGEMIDYGVSGPEKFVQDRMKKHSGGVFRTSLLGEKMAVFCGPEGNRFLFSNQNKNLTTWWPKAFLKPVSFPLPKGRTVKDATQVLRAFLHEFLGPESLKRCIPIMDLMCRKHMEADWEPHAEVKLYPLSKIITFSLACRLFLGMEDPKLVDTMRGYFDSVESFMISVPINLPGTSYNKALRIGMILKEEILRMIRQKRNHDDEDEAYKSVDLLSHVLFRSKNDNKISMKDEKDICTLLMSVLLATYDDTSAAITFVLKFLAQLPHIYDQVYKECVEIGRSKGDAEEPLNWNDLQKMKYCWNVAREMLRLMPPSPGTYREVTSDLNYQGFTIPRGWKTFWSVYSTHKDPKYFPNPDEFDPSRYEGNGPAPYTFVPFGGGHRMCPGREYARAQILVFMYNVVTRFKLELLDPDEKVKYHITPFPESGLPIGLTPHQKT